MDHGGFNFGHHGGFNFGHQGHNHHHHHGHHHRHHHQPDIWGISISRPSSDLRTSSTDAKCCCGCSLRQGTYIVGQLSLGLAILGAVINFLFAAIGSDVPADEIPPNGSNTLVYLLWCSFGVYVGFIPPSICLIVGVFKQHLSLLLVWLLAYPCLAFMGVVLVTVEMAISGSQFLPIIFGIVAFIQIFLILVVVEYVRELKRRALYTEIVSSTGNSAESQGSVDPRDENPGNQDSGNEIPVITGNEVPGYQSSGYQGPDAQPSRSHEQLA